MGTVLVLHCEAAPSGRSLRISASVPPRQLRS